MKSSLLKYVLVMGVVALGVLLLGFTVVDAGSRSAIVVGVGVAFVAQAVSYTLLEGVFFTGRRVVVYLTGMLVRLAVVVWMLFAAERLFGVSTLAAVMSMLVVLFVTTLLEPVFSQSDS